MAKVLQELVSSYGLAGALALAACVYVLRQFWTIGLDYWRDRRSQARFIAALYAEIDYNTRDLARFLEDAAPPQRLKAMLRQKTPEQGPKVVHMTDARHTAIYAQSVEQLTFLPRVAILDVVAFYNQLEKIKVQTESLGGPTFREITDGGRDTVIDTLWRSIETGLTLGDAALRRFETEGELCWALDSGALDNARRRRRDEARRLGSGAKPGAGDAAAGPGQPRMPNGDRDP